MLKNEKKDFIFKRYIHPCEIKLILSITVFFSFIPAIWNIVDLFHIGTGKYVDGDNLPLKAAPWAKWIAILQFIAVALLFVLLITSILGIGAANNSIAKSKASEISPAFGTYIMMQDANFADCVTLDDCYGSFDYIGYTPPASVNFYYEDVGFGMRAIAKTSSVAREHRDRATSCVAKSIFRGERA